jgi:hypothetical protein
MLPVMSANPRTLRGLSAGGPLTWPSTTVNLETAVYLPEGADRSPVQVLAALPVPEEVVDVEPDISEYAPLPREPLELFAPGARRGGAGLVAQSLVEGGRSSRACWATTCWSCRTGPGWVG